ncbi:MAG: preprotein translocase subunit YajC [Bacteroidia bacterium]
MLNILLQASQGSGYSGLVMMGAIVVIMYFFMIRPQMKKAKDEKKFVDSVQKGDKVVTIGGIHGKITEISDTTFLMDIDKNVTMRVEKKSISAEATKAYQQPAAVEKK